MWRAICRAVRFDAIHRLVNRGAHRLRFFKGLYDANIFSSIFDVVPPEARGAATGLTNMIGWLGGCGAAPVAVGYIAERQSLGLAISLASLVYIAGAALLVAGIAFFVKRDVMRMEAGLEQGTKPPEWYL